MGRHLGAKVPEPRGAHCWRNVWLKVQPCPLASWALGTRQGAPLAHGALFSPFHWAWVLCRHLLSAGPQLLTPVAQPAVLLSILFYLVCMTVVPAWMSVLLV